MHCSAPVAGTPNGHSETEGGVGGRRVAAVVAKLLIKPRSDS